MSTLVTKLVITIAYVVAFVPLLPVLLFSPFIFIFSFDAPSTGTFGEINRYLLLVGGALLLASIPLSLLLVWSSSIKWALIGIPGVLFGLYMFMHPFGGIQHEYKNLNEAVSAGDVSVVEKLIKSGAPLDSVSEGYSSPPLISACFTYNFVMVETLIDAGANIFVYDSLGNTIGNCVVYSKVREGKQGEALQRVVEKIKVKGFPFPPPEPDEVLQMVKAGTWPPK